MHNVRIIAHVKIREDGNCDVSANRLIYAMIWDRKTKAWKEITNDPNVYYRGAINSFLFGNEFWAGDSYRWMVSNNGWGAVKEPDHGLAAFSTYEVGIKYMQTKQTFTWPTKVFYEKNCRDTTGIASEWLKSINLGCMTIITTREKDAFTVVCAHLKDDSEESARCCSAGTFLSGPVTESGLET